MNGPYISARDAILRDLESAEAALKVADSEYEQAERKLRLAQDTATRAYDGRAANSRNVDRLKEALAIIEGDDRAGVTS